MSNYNSIALAIFLFTLLQLRSDFTFASNHVFLHCLDTKSDPLYPTLQVTYTQLNSSFPSILEARARNARFQRPNSTKPLFIVTPKHLSNIQTSLTCCKATGLEMRIRGGGHDMEGLSYMSSVPFVILDMFNFNSVDVNLETETVWVEAGATLGDVYYNIAKKSSLHAFPGGVCPTVGTAGHFSGGGYGNLMRMYGLAPDNVVDIIIMDVNGRLLNREAMGEDLFWALRGGGAASFGIVLSSQIKLVRVPQKVTVFKVQRSLEEGASQTLYRWQTVAPNLPKELFIRFQVAVIEDQSGLGPDLGSSNKLQISFIGLFLGRAKKLVELLAKMLPELVLLEKECIEMSWVESTLFWDGIPNGTAIEVLTSKEYEKVARKVKSDYVKKPIPQAALDHMWTELLGMDGLVMEWNPYGGRMSEISEHENAYPYRRGNLFKIEYDFKWYKQGVEVEKHYVDLSRKLYDYMAPYVSASPRQAFFNYRDLDLGTHSTGGFLSFAAKYYGPNYLRLVKVKSQVDPLNFLKNEQSVPPISAN